MTQHTKPGQSVAPERSPARSVGALVGLLVGALALVVAFVPGLFVLAWPLAAVAILVSSRAVRDGTDVEARAARIGRGLGWGAVVVGLVNLVIVLGGFDYFSGGG